MKLFSSGVIDLVLPDLTLGVPRVRVGVHGKFQVEASDASRHVTIQPLEQMTVSISYLLSQCSSLVAECLYTASCNRRYRKAKAKETLSDELMYKCKLEGGNTHGRHYVACKEPTVFTFESIQTYLSDKTLCTDLTWLEMHKNESSA